MRRTIRRVVVLAAALSLWAPATGRALPVGDPTVRLALRPGGDAQTFRIEASAQDPDGHVMLCVAAEEVRRCVGMHADPSGLAGEAEVLTDSARECVAGDSRTLSFEHRFATTGLHSVTAQVVGQGCPRIGSTVTRSVTRRVVVLPPGDDITCSDAGAPFASDTGVTADAIRLGAVTSATGWGPSGRAFDHAMTAAVDAINAAGGVCGRSLELTWADDRDNPQGAYQAVTGLIDDGVFSFVGMPGFMFDTLVAKLTSANVPVVGTQGKIAAEFSSSWFWPMAPPNSVSAVQAVEEAYERGARSFALVSADDRYESAQIRDAFLDAVASHADARSRVYELSKDENPAGVGALYQRYRTDCLAEGCDMLMFAVQPVPIIAWCQAAGGDRPPRYGAAIAPRGADPALPEVCGPYLDGVDVWTGYDAPGVSRASAATEFAAEFAAIDPHVDPNAPLVEGAYAAVRLFALAAARVGANLTRARLKVELDSDTFNLGLTANPLSWASDHAANRSVQGIGMTFGDAGFDGWTIDTGWRA